MNYPYKAWSLTTSLIAKEIEIVGELHSFGGEYLKTKSGKLMSKKEVFSTRYDALKEAQNSIQEQQKKIEKMQANLQKRASNVAKQLEI